MANKYVAKPTPLELNQRADHAKEAQEAVTQKRKNLVYTYKFLFLTNSGLIPVVMNPPSIPFAHRTEMVLDVWHMSHTGMR